MDGDSCIESGWDSLIGRRSQAFVEVNKSDAVSILRDDGFPELGFQFGYSHGTANQEPHNQNLTKLSRMTDNSDMTETTATAILDQK